MKSRRTTRQEPKYIESALCLHGQDSEREWRAWRLLSTGTVGRLVRCVVPIDCGSALLVDFTHRCATSGNRFNMGGKHINLTISTSTLSQKNKCNLLGRHLCVIMPCFNADAEVFRQSPSVRLAWRVGCRSFVVLSKMCAKLIFKSIFRNCLIKVITPLYKQWNTAVSPHKKGRKDGEKNPCKMSYVAPLIWHPFLLYEEKSWLAHIV